MTLYMVLFQSSFVILCSTHGSLQKFDCNWSAMGTETNSSLDTDTELTIFNYLLIIFSPHSATKFINISLKDKAIRFYHSRTFTFKQNYITNC